VDNFDFSSKILSEQVTIKSNFIAEGRFKVSAMAQRLISFCIYKMTVCCRNDKKSFQAEFSFKEFLSLLGMKRCSQKTLTLIKQATEECQKAFISYETNSKFVTMPWFQLCMVDKKLDVVSFTFNDSVGEAIMDYSNGFIAEKLQLLGKLQSYYAMRWYDLTMTQKGQMGRNGNSWNQWYCQYSIQDIRAIFGIKSEEYAGRMDNFFKYVVEKPIEELNRVNKKYVIEVQKVRTGRNLSDVMLVCTELEADVIDVPVISTVDDVELTQIEQETMTLTSYRDTYPELWDEMEQKVMSELGNSVRWTSKAYIDDKVMKMLAEKLKCSQTSED